MSKPATARQSTRPHFVLARADTKGAIWPDYPNRPATLKQAKAHKAKGGLVGFYPGSLGFVCVDIDLPKALKRDGTAEEKADYTAKAREALVARLGEPAVEQSTGSGGLHCFYAVETGRAPVRNGKWKLDCFEPGDIRGDKGYAVIYRPGLIADLQDAAMFAAPLDMARLDAMRTRRQATDADTWPEGERNESFNLVAHAAARRGDTAGVAAAVAKARESGLPEGEIRATLASAVMAGARDYSPPVTADDFEDAPEDAPRDSQDGNATMAELYAMDPEETRWIVEGLIPAGGLTVLAGSPFDGKSTWTRDLSASTALGRPFMGRETERGRVLHIALQDKPGALQRWFRALDAPDNDSVRVFWRWTADGKPIAALRAAIEAHGACLAVVDTLAVFTGAQDLDSYAKASRTLTPYLDLARDTGAALVMIHHIRKPGREGPDETVAAVMGSQAIAGVADTLLTLRRLDGGHRVLEARHRDAEDIEPALLELDTDTGRVRFGGAVEDADMEAAETAVLATLARAQEEGLPGLSATELRERTTGKRKALLSAARDRLVFLGKVEKQRDGNRDLYSVAPEIEDEFDD